MKAFYSIIISLLIIQVLTNNKANQHMSKFDKAYKSCNENQCKERSNDENCIFLCINERCHSDIYGNYLLEYGELNPDLKNKFEKCFNNIK
jgi:hypothetical protein